MIPARCLGRPLLAACVLAGGLAGSPVAAEEVAPAEPPAQPVALPGHWLFIPADTEAGLAPQLGWTLPGGTRFLLVALACAPDAGTLTLRREVLPTADPAPVARTLWTASGPLTVTAAPEDRDGAMWIGAEFPVAVLVPLLAVAGPWQIDDPPGRLADAEAGPAFAAFRIACGLGSP